MKSLFKLLVVAVGLVAAGTSVQAQQKFAHINSGDLLQSMPEMKTADATFNALAKTKQTALENMDKERQKKITAYTAKAKTISEANKEVVGKELDALRIEIQDMEKRIGETEQKSQEELKAKQAELYQPAIKKAEAAVQTVAKEKGFAYVFDVSQPGVVYFDGGEDILPLVKAKLGITGAAPAAAAPKKK